MLSELNRAAIKGFVKETLGCACPDEVFADIDYHSHAAPAPDSPYSIKLIAGRRLLIYLLNLTDLESLEFWLPAMIRQGKQERDQRGLNRFRAVIITDQKDRLAPLAARLFKEGKPSDERVHLHVLSAEESKAMDFVI